MSNIFSKNFHLCFPKFKCSLMICAPPPPPPSQPDGDQDNHHPPPHSTATATTSSSSTSIMIKNFNSLYDFTTTSSSTSKSTDHFSSSSSDEYSDDTDAPPPDFDSLIASERFFFSSPGRSNSIFETTLPETPLPQSETLLSGSVAIPKYSPNPYKDFRRSMQEMVEAMELVNVRDAWENLHELLLCYLNLNPKETHNIITNAFSDLVIDLMSTENIQGNFDHGRNGRQSVSRRLQL